MYMYIHAYICMHMYVYEPMHANVLHTYIYMHVYICMRMYVYEPMHANVFMYVCVCLCVRDIQIRIHTSYMYVCV